MPKRRNFSNCDCGHNKVVHDQDGVCRICDCPGFVWNNETQEELGEELDDDRE